MNAAELKKRFGAYGLFYRIDTGEHRYRARAYLDLVAHDKTPLEPSDLLSRPVDRVVVMMNPGSSCPLPPAVDDGGPVVADPSQIMQEHHLVPAKPDTTQYQIMRIMAVRGFKHVRILNLSDLRNPKSAGFMRSAAGLDEVGVTWHSLWSPERAHEREWLLSSFARQDPTTIVAWGRDKKLAPWAEAALSGLGDSPIAGVRDPADPRLFGHASPTLQAHKDRWLNTILDLS